MVAQLLNSNLIKSRQRRDCTISTCVSFFFFLSRLALTRMRIVIPERDRRRGVSTASPDVGSEMNDLVTSSRGRCRVKRGERNLCEQGRRTSRQRGAIALFRSILDQNVRSRLSPRHGI